MKKQLFLLLFFALGGLLSAQSNVQIMDIALKPVIEIDTITGLPLDTLHVKYVVSFKVYPVQDTDKAHILIGSDQDLGDVENIIADFVSNLGINELYSGGTSYVVNNYTAQAEITLTTIKDQDFEYITLYVEDHQGNFTDKLYFKK